MLRPQVEGLRLRARQRLRLSLKPKCCQSVNALLVGVIATEVAGKLEFAASQQPRGVTQFFSLPLAPQASR